MCVDIVDILCIVVVSLISNSMCVYTHSHIISDKDDNHYSIIIGAALTGSGDLTWRTTGSCGPS